MRKSHYITILLGGAAALALWSLADTKNPVEEDAKLYGNTSACEKEHEASECQKAFDAAKEQHIKEAPKFSTAFECEAAGYTRCETAEVKTAEGGHTSFFMPMMMGYMMGRMMNGGGMMGGSGFYGAGQPVYADRNGFLYAGGNNIGRVAPGTTSLGSEGVPMRTASRGGFGNTAQRFGGAGT